MSNKTVLDHLNHLNEVVNNLSDQDLTKLIEVSDFSEESCKQYAFLENSLLDHFGEFPRNSPEFLRQT